MSGAPVRGRLGSGLGAGLVAGTVGLACCVGPAAAAAVGVVSAATAADVAYDLYGSWGWAFKLAGAAVGIGLIVRARRRAQACSAGPGRVRRFAVVVAISGVATYGALYALTTYLGKVAT